jgi:hypothetical protein
LTREFFNLEKDIYLCFIYDPPGNSTYTHSLEEEDVTKYAVDGDIILMGDRFLLFSSCVKFTFSNREIRQWSERSARNL